MAACCAACIFAALLCSCSAVLCSCNSAWEKHHKSRAMSTTLYHSTCYWVWLSYEELAKLSPVVESYLCNERYMWQRLKFLAPLLAELHYSKWNACGVCSENGSRTWHFFVTCSTRDTGGRRPGKSNTTSPSPHSAVAAVLLHDCCSASSSPAASCAPGHTAVPSCSGTNAGSWRLPYSAGLQYQELVVVVQEYCLLRN